MKKVKYKKFWKNALPLAGGVLAVISYFLINYSILGGLLVYAVSMLCIALGYAFFTNARSFVYEVTSDVLYGLGITFIATAPIEYTVADGSYWVYAITGLLT